MNPRAWKQLVKNRVAAVSLVFLVIITLMAAFAPVVTKYSYEEQNISEKLEGPSTRHWLGTDTLGRDLYSRIVYGARMSLAVGIMTAIIALFLGTLTGAIAGYAGGWVDNLLMRLVDLFYIFPSLLMAILLMILMGRGFAGILLAIGLTAWVTQARLVRGQVMQTKALPFVESARATGVGHIAIVVRHILPNIWGPVIVSLTFQIPTNIMSESFLSFIGLGLQPPYSSWGTLASEGFRAMRSYPHLIVFPGLVLFITMLAFNYLGDGLRDALDPKSGSGSL
ncbi:MAG: peptide ABC transporter permease [Bdellovibrionales bacterium RIFOXYD1_FULL_53_11]|nr:MAG: peptide ABC transporter permease [Bdellovibrionales bacterium RIFOXYD1_FULL_53_11]